MSDPAKTQSKQHYKRVLLKISGESLMGRLRYGIDPEMVGMVAQQVKDVVATGIEVCLVIGGGNIFRGVSGAAAGMERAYADSSELHSCRRSVEAVARAAPAYWIGAILLD